MPILDEEVARTFEEKGWQVERLPGVALNPEALRALELLQGNSNGPGEGSRGRVPR